MHPRCALERAEDLAEVRLMIDEGEFDVAIDELRWLLGGCSGMIDAHFLLGKLAVEADGDIPLARGHFGYGYQLGLRALRRNKMPSPVLALHPANAGFFNSGRGLVWCLHELGKTEMAREVLEQLLACDPQDPLNLSLWLKETEQDGLVQIDFDRLVD